MLTGVVDQGKVGSGGVPWLQFGVKENLPLSVSSSQLCLRQTGTHSVAVETGAPLWGGHWESPRDFILNSPWPSFLPFTHGVGI